MLQYRVWYCYLEEGKYFEDYVLATGSSRHEVEIDAKEIIQGRGVYSYKILRFEKLR